MAAGSYKWAAWLDHHITLEGTLRNLTVCCQKSRNCARFEPFLIKLNEENMWFEFLADYEKKFTDQNLKELFVSFNADRVSVPDLIQRAETQKICSKDTVRKLIKMSNEFEVDKTQKTHHLVLKQDISDNT